MSPIDALSPSSTSCFEDRLIQACVISTVALAGIATLLYSQLAHHPHFFVKIGTLAGGSALMMTTVVLAIVACTTFSRPKIEAKPIISPTPQPPAHPIVSLLQGDAAPSQITAPTAETETALAPAGPLAVFRADASAADKQVSLRRRLPDGVAADSKRPPAPRTHVTAVEALKSVDATSALFTDRQAPAQWSRKDHSLFYETLDALVVAKMIPEPAQNFVVEKYLDGRVQKKSVFFKFPDLRYLEVSLGLSEGDVSFQINHMAGRSGVPVENEAWEYAILHAYLQAKYNIKCFIPDRLHDKDFNNEIFAIIKRFLNTLGYQRMKFEVQNKEGQDIYVIQLLDQVVKKDKRGKQGYDIPIIRMNAKLLDLLRKNPLALDALEMLFIQTFIAHSNIQNDLKAAPFGTMVCPE